MLKVEFTLALLALAFVCASGRGILSIKEDGGSSMLRNASLQFHRGLLPRCTPVVPTSPAYDENDPSTYLLPDPQDCTMFYICDEEGVAHHAPCAADLHFSAITHRCEYPEDAMCVEQECPPEVPPGSLPCDWSCPNPDYADIVLYPDPTNSNRFYICGNGIAYRFDCPATTFWDPIKRTCTNEDKSIKACGDFIVPCDPEEPNCECNSYGYCIPPPEPEPEQPEEEHAPENDGETPGDAGEVSDDQPQPPHEELEVVHEAGEVRLNLRLSMAIATNPSATSND